MVVQFTKLKKIGSLFEGDIYVVAGIIIGTDKMAIEGFIMSDVDSEDFTAKDVKKMIKAQRDEAKERIKVRLGIEKGEQI